MKKPDRPFHYACTFELQNASCGVPEEHEIRRSPDLETKIVKGTVGKLAKLGILRKTF